MNSAYIFLSSMKSQQTLHKFLQTTIGLENRYTAPLKGTTKQSNGKRQTLSYHDIYCDFLLTTFLTPNRHYIISLRDRGGSFRHVMAATYTSMTDIDSKTVQNKCKKCTWHGVLTIIYNSGANMNA